MLSVYLMYRRFARAFKIAAREEGFIQIFGAGLLLVIVGTVTYTLSQDWSLVDGFYFAIATLTTSSIADPHLTITSGSIKVFTVLYILIGIGILVELARQIGFAFVEVRREDHTAKQGQEGRQSARRPCLASLPGGGCAWSPRPPPTATGRGRPSPFPRRSRDQRAVARFVFAFQASQRFSRG